MERINAKYRYKTTPCAKKEAIIKGENYRFTVLSPCLVRMEYSMNGVFEDRATQVVINRDFDVPNFEVVDRKGCLRIRTESIEIVYMGGAFSRHNLSARFAGELGSSPYEWHYGDAPADMGGTARTLDNIDGACPLDRGVVSRGGMAVLDDSKSLILADDGWVDVRTVENIDIYLFAHGYHYYEALQDFYKLTGNTPLLPRFAMGNWWSRYYRYTQDEYQQLMLEFKKREIPFSVAVIDMDWHLVNIDPKYGSGWTGFTWDEELFPNHKAFLDFLHEEGMEVTLNLHPAEGIAAHEKCYQEVAEHMGVDAASEEKVLFDVADPKFVEMYFEKILHPMEEEGVSFWWMDWQQGSTTKIPELDPLWMLNHYHYVDMQIANKRPLIFSRYSGPGSHRYPIGFSGDAFATWESLDFQPYFTANASNIGYGWWSHDLGGHLPSIRDDELITRWVQLGVFSPIARLHSCNNPFQAKEPWRYNKIAEESMVSFLRLRHRLIPYLYTMNYISHMKNIPLVQPLYYISPDQDSAYSYNRNEYLFGSEMLVSPITTKADSVTDCGCSKTYLPKGMWFDFFNSRKYYGGRCIKVYRDIYSMPVFVKAGGIIPLAEPEHVNDICNPKKMSIVVFPGADNNFTLYEDDGKTMNYQNGAYVETRFSYRWGSRPEFVIHKPMGNLDIIVHDRDYTIEFRKITECQELNVKENGKDIPFETRYENETLYVSVKGVNGTVKICFNQDVAIPENDYRREIFEFLCKAKSHDLQKLGLEWLLNNTSDPTEFIAGILALDLEPCLREAMTELALA